MLNLQQIQLDENYYLKWPSNEKDKKSISSHGAKKGLKSCLYVQGFTQKRNFWNWTILQSIRAIFVPKFCKNLVFEHLFSQQLLSYAKISWNSKCFIDMKVSFFQTFKLTKPNQLFSELFGRTLHWGNSLGIQKRNPSDFWHLRTNSKGNRLNKILRTHMNTLQS